MFQLVSILKGVLEILLFVMLGQAVLYVLAGRHRDTNFVLKALRMATDPLHRFFRAITPRFVVDAHVPFVTFFFLGVLWVAALIGKLILFRQFMTTGGAS